MTVTGANGCTTSATLTLGEVVPAQSGSYVLVFPTGTNIGTGNPPVITLPDPLPAGFDLSFGVQGGVTFERKMVVDRINGYEIRQVDSSTGRFPIMRSDLFTVTGTDANGCQRTVQGILANLPAR